MSESTPKHQIRTNDAYVRYIHSPEWRAKSKMCLEAAGHLCQKCKRRRATQSHHLTYERLFHELPADLLAVCKPCHEGIHGRALTPYVAPVRKITPAEKQREKRMARYRRKFERDRLATAAKQI